MGTFGTYGREESKSIRNHLSMEQREEKSGITRYPNCGEIFKHAGNPKNTNRQTDARTRAI